MSADDRQLRESTYANGRSDYIVANSVVLEARDNATSATRYATTCYEALLRD